MSLRPSYARESRSQYARSASFDDRRQIQQRSLSTAVVEREISYPTLAWDPLDDLFLFPLRPPRLYYDDFVRRLRWRLYDDIIEREVFKPAPIEVERKLSVTFRDYDDSSSTTTRNVPIQRSPSTVTVYREKIDKNNEWSSNKIERQEETFKTQAGGRYAADEWSIKQEEPPTRKRSSITIFVRQPHIEYSDPPPFQRTTSIRDYSSTKRRSFY